MAFWLARLLDWYGLRTGTVFRLVWVWDLDLRTGNGNITEVLRRLSKLEKGYFWAFSSDERVGYKAATSGRLDSSSTHPRSPCTHPRSGRVLVKSGVKGAE